MRQRGGGDAARQRVMKGAFQFTTDLADAGCHDQSNTDSGLYDEAFRGRRVHTSGPKRLDTRGGTSREPGLKGCSGKPSSRETSAGSVDFGGGLCSRWATYHIFLAKYSPTGGMVVVEEPVAATPMKWVYWRGPRYAAGKSVQEAAAFLTSINTRGGAPTLKPAGSTSTG